jgi:3-oxoacyl-(acyl-carrier-protein) synthase
VRLPVAIVGRAWRTPLGDTIDEVVARLLAGERAVAPNPRFPAAAYACTLAAAIPHEPARSRNARFLRRMGLFGLEVAHEALAASGQGGGPRAGLFSGVGGLRAHWDDMMGALVDQRDDGQGAWSRGLRDIHPYWMLKHLSNNVHALASAELGLHGEGATFGGGNAGAQAIAAAARALWDGAIDVALVVAHDSLLEPETLVELGARRAATLAMSAAEVAAPYDARAAGFVPGEAAAAIVIVRPADARSPYAIVEAADTADGAVGEPGAEALGRMVTQLAEASGMGDASRAEPGLDATERDAAARSGTEARGRDDVAARSGAEALGRIVAQLGDAGAGVVDGASRAWPELDAAERGVLAVLGVDTPLVSIAAATGRLGAATAVVQAIALGELLRRGVLPPIAGLEQPAGGACRPLAAATPTRARSAIALSTAVPGLAAGIRVEIVP